MTSGVEQRLRLMGDGDHFGEVALLRDVARTASITTLTPCVFLTLNRSQFQALVKAAPAVADQLKRVSDVRATEA